MNALGTYTLVSLSFVIGTMFEFAIVLRIERQSPGGNRESSKSALFKQSITSLQPKSIHTPERIEIKEMELNHRPRFYSFTEKVDILTYFVFMMSYIIFNCIYFNRYM